MVTVVVLLYRLTRSSGIPVKVSPPPTSVGAGRRSPAPGASRPAGPASPASLPSLLVAASGWSLPAPLSRAVVLPAGDQLRVFGGLGPAGVTSGAVLQVDPVLAKVSTIARLADPVHDAAGAELGAQGVVFGGGAAQVVATVQALGANAATVTRTGTLPTRRADLAATSVGGRAILVGGYDGTAWSPDVLSTADGATFSVLTQLKQPVRYPSVVAIGSLVYVIGGEVPTGGDSASIQIVDVAAHTAVVAGHLPAGLSHAGAAVIGGSIYLFGGRSAGQALDTVSRLDPATGVARPVAHLPVPLSDMGVATVGATTYLVGGENGAGQPVAAVAQAALGSAA